MLAFHHAFGVDVLGVLLATVTEFIINIVKRRIMKIMKFENLMSGIVKAIKLIDIKKILGGALQGSSLGISTPRLKMKVEIKAHFHVQHDHSR
jgi:hypothetical protein